MIGVDVHPHTFRHSFAINLVRTGLNLRRVQQLLGHSNLNTAQVSSTVQRRGLARGVQRGRILKCYKNEMSNCNSPKMVDMYCAMHEIGIPLPVLKSTL
jgi:hypothetical protein